MNKSKKYIFVSIMIILLIMMVLCIMLLNKEDNQGKPQNSNEMQTKYEIKEETKKVNIETDFFTVENCINKYINDISSEDENLIYLLDEEYVNNNHITKENSFDFVHTVKEESKFIAINMNVKVRGNFSTFAVHGLVSNDDNLENNEIYIIINLDLHNRTFSVIPLIDERYSSVEDIKIKAKEKDISKNFYNSFEYCILSDEDVCRKYIENYKTMILYNPESIYEKLDEEYKQKRFGNIENFKEYVENKREHLENIIITEYLVNRKGNVKEYIVIDMYDNYYKFVAKNVMDYTLVLDDYTIKTDEFNKSYLNAPNNEKAFTNIDIFIKMLNNKDYNNAYNKLSQGFKSNYFKTVNEFKYYVKSNLFRDNYISIIKMEEKSGLYICKVNISSGTNLAAETITKTFIVKLNEGTDFELSFDV